MRPLANIYRHFTTYFPSGTRDTTAVPRAAIVPRRGGALGCVRRAVGRDIHVMHSIARAGTRTPRSAGPVTLPARVRAGCTRRVVGRMLWCAVLRRGRRRGAERQPRMS